MDKQAFLEGYLSKEASGWFGRLLGRQVRSSAKKLREGKRYNSQLDRLNPQIDDATQQVKHNWSAYDDSIKSNPGNGSEDLWSKARGSEDTLGDLLGQRGELVSGMRELSMPLRYRKAHTGPNDIAGTRTDMLQELLDRDIRGQKRALKQALIGTGAVTAPVLGYAALDSLGADPDTERRRDDISEQIADTERRRDEVDEQIAANDKKIADMKRRRDEVDEQIAANDKKIASVTPAVVEGINPTWGAGGGAVLGGAGSLLRDYLKSEDPSYKRAALAAIVGGALGYGGTHAYNAYKA
jgi:chromosome segregation ATPase